MSEYVFLKVPPEEIKFRTKYELSFEMIDNAMGEGIPFFYVTIDGFYGGNPELLSELGNRGLTFVADIVSILLFMSRNRWLESFRKTKQEEEKLLSSEF
jgi:hypothetical protein